MFGHPIIALGLPWDARPCTGLEVTSAERVFCWVAKVVTDFPQGVGDLSSRYPFSYGVHRREPAFCPGLTFLMLLMGCAGSRAYPFVKHSVGMPAAMTVRTITMTYGGRISEFAFIVCKPHIERTQTCHSSSKNR